jgi:hypothetical protein
MAGPNFSAQQLNRYQIARVHLFNFDRDIDQTIGLHHGSQYPRPLWTSRSNFEDTFFSSEHTAQKVAPVSPFGKLLLKDRLYDRPTIAPMAAHFEHRRPHELLERHH